MSTLFKTSLLLTVFFGLNKLVALVRQVIVARQFGLSSDIDTFNVANNVPDLLVSLIAGGALALAFVPVLSEYIRKSGRESAWKLFSSVANLVFLVTAILSLLAAIFAPFLVSFELGIAPGFTANQQVTVVNLMRLSLLSTLIFSISGLVTSSLHAYKHFLLPALSPILYNLGLIFGVVFLVPEYGVYGLGFGVIIGSVFHLIIQIPALFRFNFRYFPILNLKDEGLIKVLKLMGPRILTVLLIQIIFLARDNLASRLAEGTVSALTYGYYIMQVPETLIGTAIATALLPTLSELITDKKFSDFSLVLNRTIKILAATTIFISVILSLCLGTFVESIFNLRGAQADLLVWTTRAYLVGLLSQCLLEVIASSFYARQRAVIPLVATFIRTVIFLLLSVITFKTFGAFGLALVDSITVTLEVVILVYYLHKSLPGILSNVLKSSLRYGIGLVISILVVLAILSFAPLPSLPKAILAILLASIVYIPFIRKELALLLKL